MTTEPDTAQPSLLEPDLDGGVHSTFVGSVPQFEMAEIEDDRPLRPINWNLLTGDEAEAEWLDLKPGSTGCARPTACRRRSSHPSGTATTSWSGSSQPSMSTG